MVRATTPTLTLTIKDTSVDLSLAQNVYVTLSQGDNFNVTKTGDDIEVDTRVVKCWLSQTESLQLAIGQALSVQINWTYLDTDGVTVRRAATNVGSVSVSRQLLPEVIA